MNTPSKKPKSVKRNAEFIAFIRVMASKSPDVMAVWREAKTPAQKDAAKKAIIQIGRKKAVMRDEIAGFVRNLTYVNLSLVHKHLFDVHTGQVMLQMIGGRQKKGHP